MKKLLILLLALVAALSFCACGKSDSVGNETDNSTKDNVTTGEPSEPTFPENVETLTINLNDYVITVGEGVETYGKVAATVDSTRLCKDLEQRASLWKFGDSYYFRYLLSETGETIIEEVPAENINEILEEMIFVLRMMPYTAYQMVDSGLEVPTNLSNGDEIDVRWLNALEVYGEEECQYLLLEEILKVKFVYSDCTAVVQGLAPLLEVDPFEDVRLSIKGDHGEAYVSDHWSISYIRLADGTIKKLNVRTDTPANNGSLKNGDKVRVYLREEEAERICKTYCIRLTRTEADVEIHGRNGNPNYVPGTPGVVNLKDYVMISDMCYENGGEYKEFYIDGGLLANDYYQYLSENVATEDLLGWNDAYWAVVWLLNGQVDLITCKNRPYEEGRGIAESGLADGDVLEMSWNVDHEAFAHLQRLLNVDLVFEDFTYTYQQY